MSKVPKKVIVISEKSWEAIQYHLRATMGNVMTSPVYKKEIRDSLDSVVDATKLAEDAWTRLAFYSDTEDDEVARSLVRRIEELL